MIIKQYTPEQDEFIRARRLSRPFFKKGDTAVTEMRPGCKLPRWISVVINTHPDWEWVMADNAGHEKFEKMFPEFTVAMREQSRKDDWKWNTFDKAEKYLANGYRKWKCR